MLTRLFSNISVQAGIIAVLCLLILNTAGVYFLDFQGFNFQISGNSFVFGTSLIKVLFVFISTIVAIVFASNVNSLGIFPASFQKSIFFGISFLLIIPFPFQWELILALPLILLSFRKIFKIGMLDDPRHLLFDIGVIAGLISLFYVEAIIMVSFCWMASLIFRSFNIKTIIIPIIGVFAAYTLAFFLSFIWPDFKLTEILRAQFVQIEWSFVDFDFKKIIKLSGLLLIGLLAIFNVFMSIVKATVFKRQVLTLCIGLILVCLALAISQRSLENLLVFIIFPLAIILNDFLLSLKKWWQQDLVYLLLLANLIFIFI